MNYIIKYKAQHTFTEEPYDLFVTANGFTDEQEYAKPFTFDEKNEYIKNNDIDGLIVMKDERGN